MPLWKQLLLGFYYYGSRPLRAVRNAQLAARGRAPVSVVMYHRIANDAANAWTTHTDVFVREIRWLQRHFDLVSLAEAQDRIRSPRSDRAAVSITFDDGYAVNSQCALPMLIDAAIPFTYFVTSSAVLQRACFPHDVAMGNSFEPNTLDQLRELTAAGVEVGGHTRTHADLGEIQDEVALYDEIVTASREIETALDRPVRYFAFPFGQHANLNVRGFEIAADAGFEGVVSAYGGYNFPGDDAFHLQRMGVDGPLIRLKNWTTLDPYKQWKIARFRYRRGSSHSQIDTAVTA